MCEQAYATWPINFTPSPPEFFEELVIIINTFKSLQWSRAYAFPSNASIYRSIHFSENSKRNFSIFQCQLVNVIYACGCVEIGVGMCGAAIDFVQCVDKPPPFRRWEKEFFFSLVCIINPMAKQICASLLNTRGGRKNVRIEIRVYIYVNM